MEQFRFRKWEVYRDSQKLYSDILAILKTFPREHQYSIGDQISRSSFSIILNMAEGSGKATTKDLSRFLDISLGSAYETLACIDVLAENKFITAIQQQDFERRIKSICSQIGGFKKKLRSQI